MTGGGPGLIADGRHGVLLADDGSSAERSHLIVRGADDSMQGRA